MIYTGDCLDILPTIKEDSVDLIYLDPPYNTGKKWTGKIGTICEGLSFDDSFGDGYIEFMQRVLRALHRVLKSTGSIYLHCDNRECHYLKVSMDSIFGRRNFRNEIVWCYTGPSGARKHFPRKHDNILFYSKSRNYTFNHEDVRVPYQARYSATRSMHNNLGNISPARHNQGKIIEDWWTHGMSNTAQWKKELTGYPTQKPMKLLERIIRASSNPGDLVLDPFSGSGTTCIVAEQLNRRWISIDKNTATARVLRARLESSPVQLESSAGEGVFSSG